MCGDNCILPTQCCVVDHRYGTQCGAGEFCPADGGTCVPLPGCPAGLETCGNRCFDPATNCCANTTLSYVGTSVGADCFGGNYCTAECKQIKYAGEWSERPGEHERETMPSHKSDPVPACTPLLVKCRHALPRFPEAVPALLHRHRLPQRRRGRTVSGMR